MATPEHGRVERRLTAILAADVAGYSRLTSIDEEGTHAQLQDHLRSLVDPKIAEHRGRIVKNTGDGMLAEFSSVVDAVRCALDIQRGGNRIRIAGQLIDASTNAHLWADRFEGGLEDIFDLQDQVTISVVGAIAPKLEQAEIERAKRKPTERLDAYDYYLRGGVTLDFSRPGKPTDNAFIESFNGKFRTECLNAHWFMSLDDARRKCEAWRRDYNEERPHSAIGNKGPIELVNRSGAHGPP